MLAAQPAFDLHAVANPNRARAHQSAAAHRTQALTDWRELLGRVDAVTLAVPTELHAELAIGLLSSGIPVLVEKPIAASLAQADAMVAAAGRRGGPLARGHPRRSKPAVSAAPP